MPRVLKCGLRRAPLRSLPLVLGLLTATAGHALTLRDALRKTYETNPTIDAERATARATDEDSALARASGRPQILANASVNQGLDGLRALNGYNRAILAGAQLSVPVYQGGRVRSAIRAADSRASAGRATLRATEGDIFAEAVTAYLDVLRDREIVAVNGANLATLQAITRSSGERFRNGDLTRTDMAQAGARQQVGEAQLASARGQLVISEQIFARVIGLPPEGLEPPPPLPGMPASADEAVAIAENHNPALAATAAAIDAARQDVSGVRASTLPTLTFQAGSSFYNYRDRFAGIGNVSDNASQVGAVFTLPLYQGGGPAAQMRQARDRVDAAIDRREEAERQVVSSVNAAYSSWLVARQRIDLLQQVVDRDVEALKGVRIEADAGSRQIIDVLNAALEVNNAREALIAGRHDEYAAGFQLLNAMGIADTRHIGIDSGPLYDPMSNFNHAVRALDDFSGRPRDARKLR